MPLFPLSLSALSQVLNQLSPAVIFLIAGLAVCLSFYVYYWHCIRPRPHTLEWIAMSEQRLKRRHVSFTAKLHRFTRRDILPMLLVTVVYAATAFYALGDLSAPQTYTVFQPETVVSFSFEEPVTVDKFTYYSSLGTGSYRLEYLDEAMEWQTLKLDQNYIAVFKWNTAQPEEPITASRFRISADKVERQEGLWLTELSLWNGDTPLVPDSVSAGGEALFDESHLWAAKDTYMNSSYFDEIYHPRTALEHLKNVNPYEVSHPPLGKLILSVGIWLFGVTPFGWRFMGTLFGVLMLPILYIFLKNLFGKTAVAFCGTCLFAFDFMHLVQTRIATIDTYGVFFILLSYFFMYRWLCIPAGTKLGRCVPSLFFCGLFWGIGCASKWTVVYAGLGLAVLWLLGMIFKGRDWAQLTAVSPENPGARSVPGFGGYAVGTILLCILFFVVIPLCIYLAAYIPYATARGDLSFGSLVKVTLDNQVFMFTYHKGVHTPHPYESYWYQWIFDIRPILYYRDLDNLYTLGTKSLFASFNNPLVSWMGLLSFFALIVQTIRRKSGKGLFILIAILSQILPWLSIGRILFAYHYFPTVLFLVFAISFLMNDMLTRRRRGCRLFVYGFTGCTVLLYAMFYPALTGLPMTQWYSETFLRWLPSWPL